MRPEVILRIPRVGPFKACSETATRLEVEPYVDAYLWKVSRRWRKAYLAPLDVKPSAHKVRSFSMCMHVFMNVLVEYG